MEHIALLLAGSTSVLLRSEALTHGIDDNALARLVRGGHLVRVRHGAYVLRQTWEAADPAARHGLLTEAVLRQYDNHVALSHSSAVLKQGGPSWGLDLASVHLTHLSGGGRKGARVVHHHGCCRVGDLTRVEGHWITTPTRTVLDTATVVSPEAAVVVASDFMHRGLTTRGEIVQMNDRHKMWPHSLGINVMLHLADGRFESVAETRTAYLCWAQGLPAPEPQWKVYRSDGRVFARVDFAWPKHRLLCEFDGRIKYTRLRRPNESIEETVLREKRREELVLELTGWRMIRLTWADLDRPATTAARIRRLLARAA